MAASRATIHIFDITLINLESQDSIMLFCGYKAIHLEKLKLSPINRISFQKIPIGEVRKDRMLALKKTLDFFVPFSNIFPIISSPVMGYRSFYGTAGGHLPAISKITSYFIKIKMISMTGFVPNAAFAVIFVEQTNMPIPATMPDG